MIDATRIGRNVPSLHDASLYRMRHKIESKRDAAPLLPLLIGTGHSARSGVAEVLALERDGKTGVQLDGFRSVGVSRLEVIEGPSGRRRRTKAERARIAAESLMAGVTVADVARKHGTLADL